MTKRFLFPALLFLVFIASPLRAHDLTDREVESVGNSIELGIWEDMIYVDYWIAIGDIEALNFYPLIDTDRNGSVSDDEKELFLEKLEKDVIRNGVRIVVDGRTDLSFSLYSSSIYLEDSKNAPVPIKINFEFLLDVQRLRSMNMLPSDLNEHSLIFYMTNILDRPVLTKLFIAQGQGINIAYTPEQRENTLIFKSGFWLEPDAWSGIKLNYQEVGRELRPNPVFNRPEPGGKNTVKQTLIGYIKSSSFLWLGLLIAFIYGAGHALTPGHGKTLVAAYLVGSRGTVWQAVMLGLTVTATHLGTVIIAGLLALTSSHFINQTSFSFYLGMISGLIIIALGAWIFSSRLANSHNHSHHEHSHDHHHTSVAPDSGNVSLKQILALGVSGGMVPCPTAIVVLLMAITLKKTIWGLFLIAAFSLGLAGVMVAIGIMMVAGVSFMNSSKKFIGINLHWVIRIASILSPALIILIGFSIIAMNLINSGIVILNPAALP